MSRSVESELSREDLQLIEIHQLGTPLVVSRLAGWYLRFFRWGSWFIIGISIVFPVLNMIFGLIDWRQSLALQQPHPSPSLETLYRLEEQEQIEMLFPPLLIGVLGLLSGLFILRIMYPEWESEHLIICDHGLLQVRRKIRANQVEAVRWNEIVEIKEAAGISPPDYELIRREGKPLTIGRFYQHVDGLVEMIEQYREGG